MARSVWRGEEGRDKPDGGIMSLRSHPGRIFMMGNMLSLRSSPSPGSHLICRKVEKPISSPLLLALMLTSARNMIPPPKTPRLMT